MWKDDSNMLQDSYRAAERLALGRGDRPAACSLHCRISVEPEHLLAKERNTRLVPRRESLLVMQRVES